jgi:two-component system, LytTR family, response regulator
MKLNCIVVDDSSIQRILVTKLVDSHSSLNLIGEFSNAIETKSCLSTRQVDLLFLDIEMPVISGFNLLDGLKHKPQVIFITAKAEYAVKAFDYDATDYLQKPITKERFNAAIKRALDMQQLRKDILEEEGEHIFIKSNLKKLKIYTSKIKWIEAFGDYVKVITDEDAHLVLSTMKSFENELNKNKFIRVHKFAEIGLTKIPLSRNKKEELTRALDY